MTPEEFLNSQHHLVLSIGNYKIIIGQPSSVMIIATLLLVYFYYAIQFAWSTHDQNSRRLWGIGLFLSAATCLEAGMYYQAFGYHIRCEGLKECYATSRWESIYYLLSCLSSLFFFLAINRIFSTGRFRKYLDLIGYTVVCIYVSSLVVGNFFEWNYFLSYKYSVLMTLPMIVPITILNLYYYFKKTRTVDKVLLYSSLMLLVTSAAYFSYFGLGMTKFLWEHGFWFSENDVLHIGLIFWSWFLNSRLLKILRDVR